MSDPSSPRKSVFRQFPATFWTANGIELFERGAFYAFSAIFTVYMLATFRSGGMDQVAAASLAGTLGAVLFLLLYIVPVVGAPFAEKFGYKASLLVVFALLGTGYTLTFFATGVTLIVASVILIGVGAGIFKPIPAAVVTQTSDETKRNLAFAIYYACINIGALVFPGILGLAAAFYGWDGANITTLFRLTFAVSAALSALNLVLAIFVFRNLTPPRRDLSMVASVRSLGEVFRYPSFLVLMAIYTGFWFMYVLSLTFLSAYMLDFGRMPGWFNPSLMMTINPLVIIVLAPFMGPVTRRIEALPLMVGGIILYSLGLVTLGFSTTSLLFVAGVVLFSFGELLTHPSYLAYVSRIAPVEKVTVFLGYGFIPIGVGQFIGAKLGGDLYGRIALRDAHPSLFWAIMASVGLATAAFLAIYHVMLTRAKARAAGDATPTPAAVPAKTKRSSMMGPLAAGAIAVLLIPAVFLVALANPTAPLATAGTIEGVPANADLTVVKLADSQQQLACGKEHTETVTLPATATANATFSVTWNKPTPANPGGATTPDTYELHVTPPGGEMVMGQPSDKSPLTLTLPAKGGDYTVTVKLAKCGGEAISSPLGPLPVGSTQRTQGAFTLGGSYQTPK